MNILEEYRQRFAETVTGAKLLHEAGQVEVKPLTVKQAIGKPKQEDFPLQKGKERFLEAAGGLPVVFFGITISGATALLNLERFRPLGH